MDRDHDARTIKHDFRQAASSARQLGTHVAAATRDWINERKQVMSNRNDRNDPDRNRNNSEQNVSRGYNAESYRGSEYNQNESMRGYGEGGSQGAQGTYGVHQREDVDQANREHEQGGQWRSESNAASARGQPFGSQEYAGYSQQSRTGAPGQDRQYGQQASNWSQPASPYGQPSAQQGVGERSQSSSQHEGLGREYGQSQSRSTYGAGDDGTQGYGNRSHASQVNSQGFGQSHGSQMGGSQPGGYGASQGYGQSPGYSQPGQFGQGSYGQASGYGQQSQSQQRGGPQYGQGTQSGQGQSGYGESARGNPSGSTLGMYGQGTAGYRGKGPKGYARSDDRIQEDLNERLFHDDEIDASDVEVKVSNGVVCLDGSISERRLKYRIEDIAESCSGVKDVTNNLRVKSSMFEPASSGPSSMQSGHGNGATSTQSGGSSGGSDGLDLKSTGTKSQGATRGNAT